MSLFCKVKVSPFVGDGGGSFGVAGRDVEHEGGGSVECDRAGGGEAFGSTPGGGAAWGECAAGEAAADAVPGARVFGSGFGASGQALEQRHRGRGAAAGHGTVARTLRGLRSDFRVREAGRGPWASTVGGDATEVDDCGRAVAGEGAPGGTRAPEPSTAGVLRGSGSDRRFAARLVRGPRPGVHADRVRRRRDHAPAGDALFRRGDDRGVHEDDARALGGARASGGVLLGPLRRVPGQQEGQGGRTDAVLQGLENTWI